MENKHRTVQSIWELLNLH